MPQMLLDRAGDAPLADGYTLITSEVEFLKLSTTGTRLQIRGSLCNWAESFCRGRQIPFRELVSPTSEIQGVCERLSAEQAKAIYTALGASKFNALARPLTVAPILGALSPCRLWDGDPSRKHAAEWLLWLMDFDPNDALQPLLEEQSSWWASVADDPERVVYAACSPTDAADAIRKWVGILFDAAYSGLGNFPHPVPDRIVADARQYWKQRLTDTKGSFLLDSRAWPTDAALRGILAEESNTYFRARRECLTPPILEALAPALGWQQMRQLNNLLPPAGIEQLPTSPSDILTWFRDSYMSYRAWQFGAEDASARGLVDARAYEFGLWYLQRYPEAISSGSMKESLSFSKIVEVAKKSQQYVTLCVVLDGLHAWDAHLLKLRIQEAVGRLYVAGDSLAFAAIPTVTEFCKPALFMGVPPDKAELVQPIGQIIPENKTPIPSLSEAQLGDVFIWRILEPDRTYHKKGNRDFLLTKAEAELESVVKVIADIVDRTPLQLPLQLIVTTDHGRILGSASRTLQVPKGMNSHGRAAWGKAEVDFGASDYVVEGKIAYLNGARYGTAVDIAVSLGDEAFVMSDGTKGVEHFPHGGLYPEEVIIPWLTCIRDYVIPDVRLKISGSSDAGAAGRIQITAVNFGDVPLKLSTLMLSLGERSLEYDQLEVLVGARASISHTLEVLQWPTTAEIRRSKCAGKLSQPNGVSFVVDASIELQSNEMYYTDNILEGLP